MALDYAREGHLVLLEPGCTRRMAPPMR